MMQEPKRVMYRGRRAIDVAMMAAATMAARMAVDKIITAARGDLLAATTEGGLLIEKVTASLAVWDRRASLRARL